MVVDRLENDASSFTSFANSSFADYRLDDVTIVGCNYDDDDSSSSREEDLSHELLSGSAARGTTTGQFGYNYSYDLGESTSDGTLDEFCFDNYDHGPERQSPTVMKTQAVPTSATTTKPNPTTTTTSAMRGGRRQQHGATTKIVQFGSEELHYFIVLFDGRTRVISRTLQVLLDDDDDEYFVPSPPPPMVAPPRQKWSMGQAEERWCSSSFVSAPREHGLTTQQQQQRPPLLSLLCKPLSLVERVASV